MRIKNLVYLPFLPVALSKVTFRLIAPKGKPSVIVNNKSYEMEVHEFPVYKATVDVDAPVSYSYTINYEGTDEASKGVVLEKFERKLESGDHTLNEYFDRKITTKTHPALPKAFESYPNYSPSKLYDDTHVATVIINGDKNQFSELHRDPTSEFKVRGVEFIYATPFSVRSFNNATVSISGQSTLYAAKLSYKVSNLKNDKNKELYKRTGIKLRAEHMDPSFLRDKIYTDMLNSLGVPTPQNKFCRVFINGDAIGLFSLSDNVSNKRYLRETLNSGTKFDIENPIYKADYFPPTAIGDLSYVDNNPANEKYSIYYYKGESMDELGNEEQKYNRNLEMNKEHLIPLLQQISQYPQNKNLNMDIEMFLKFMAMEFMGGAIDNFWSRPGNYYLFKNLNFNDGEWLFLDSDFHYSFGIGGEGLNNYLTCSIDEYASLNQEVGPERPLIDNIRKAKENEDYFKNIFIRLINTAFHVDAVFPRIESLAELIRDDVEWDLSLPRVSGYTGAEDFKFTINDFDQQIKDESDNCAAKDNLIPLRCWIRNKGNNIAKELGIEYPKAPDRSMGDVETLVQTDSSSHLSFTFSITLTLICIFINIFINY
ncbi:hypothetical protein H8356DRAFT_989204 [Neocallimastix lanati (nom. inval.)]|jgi:hypothetical protein|uniref:Coth-domain-containing protein n=1 Tax=Neocallimastix californiae TaxID=1754190 RepID=A0A1Y2FB55_9FUNG|nr:hypothetical protein H8356DRAFT_989204 [Neocallimastix sp. JGI-2020a]ORY81162.1 hypothetical protein LY90DRAFT_664381 [Neocallimastix californiae]|eukprot:ORY81162.1 hypothetical protein LY90DRAFT_664381 [Neocallimastix californiae]